MLVLCIDYEHILMMPAPVVVIMNVEQSSLGPGGEVPPLIIIHPANLEVLSKHEDTWLHFHPVIQGHEEAHDPP